MEKKTLFIVLCMVLLVFSANVEDVESQGIDCYDYCSTGCVNPDTRLMQRCEGKCRIKCSPGLEVNES